ncbi:MAG: glutathione S-transferase [bacterium]|jgi:glutathione S-transferase
MATRPATGKPSAPRDVKLYMFPGSNAVRTAELMLQHKGIAYDEVILARGAHATQLPELGFSGRTVPALEIDGRRVQRTREISRALDVIKPEPRLFPAGVADRRSVEDAERFGEELQNAVRRLFYYAMTRTRAEPVDLLAARAHGATDAEGRRDLAELPARLDQIDAWLDAGVLGGDELNAADFQIAPNVAWLLCFDDIAPFVQRRPAADHALRVSGAIRRHIPRVFVDEWLTPLSVGDVDVA